MARSSRKQDVPLPEPVRNYAPRGIAGLLAPVVRPAFRKRAPAMAQLLADWDTLAGPDLARIAVPVRFSAGTLTLGCSGPAAMELQLAAPQIIARLNLALGHKTVDRLRFTQDVPGRPAATRAPALPRSASALPERPRESLPEGPLGEALARLYAGLKSRG